MVHPAVASNANHGGLQLRDVTQPYPGMSRDRLNVSHYAVLVFRYSSFSNFEHVTLNDL